MLPQEVAQDHDIDQDGQMFYPDVTPHCTTSRVSKRMSDGFFVSPRCGCPTVYQIRVDRLDAIRETALERTLVYDGATKSDMLETK